MKRKNKSYYYKFNIRVIVCTFYTVPLKRIDISIIAESRYVFSKSTEKTKYPL